MKPSRPWARRGFVGAMLVAIGAAVGGLTRWWRERARPGNRTAAVLDDRFKFDVTEFERTDPGLLLYQPDVAFETGLSRVRRLVAGPDNQIVVAGDRVVRFFSESGVVLRELSTDRPPHCLHLAAGGELFVGFGNHFEFFDLAGERHHRFPRLGDNTYLTAIAVHEETVYLADAGNREIVMCDHRSGIVTGRFGRKDAARGNPGFVVPSPYFDLRVAPDGRLRIANPGRLRVETYTRDGQFQSAWGEPGMGIDRFCGCCNPVFFTMTADGGYITSEKGLARVNVYDRAGVFQGAVAGPELLVEDRQLARRACVDCSVGAGFDVAATPDGAVLVLDPFKNSVRKFVPKSKT